MLRFQKRQQLLAGIGFQRYPVTDVGTVKAGNKLARLLQRQPLDNLASRGRIRRGRQRDAWHVRKAFMQYRQTAILWTEIMPPLRNAMRLVNGKQCHAMFGLHLFQHGQESSHQQPLWRHIQKIQITP